MFTVDERNELIQLFPKIVLSYGNNSTGSEKEDEVFVAVPEGKKYFAWFLHYRKQHMCVLIAMLPNNKFGKMFVVKTLFTRQLAAEGSIFYGTLFTHFCISNAENVSPSSPPPKVGVSNDKWCKNNNTQFFSIENLHYYKGIYCYTLPLSQKILMYENIFDKELRQHSHTPNSVIFGLPVMSKCYNDMIHTASSLPYKATFQTYINTGVLCNEPHKEKHDVSIQKNQEFFPKQLPLHHSQQQTSPKQPPLPPTPYPYGKLVTPTQHTPPQLNIPSSYIQSPHASSSFSNASVVYGFLKTEPYNHVQVNPSTQECKININTTPIRKHDNFTPFCISHVEKVSPSSKKPHPKVGVSIEKWCNQNPSYNSVNERVFKIKPDIQNDIYIIDNTSKEEFLHIPDYKTSVMMNKLFRIIKENNNLDALEESDDEEEFEDDKFDKHVFLDKSFNMLCRFNHKFKKWMPVKVVR